MAITYPRSLPNTTDIQSITVRKRAAVGVTEGEFSFVQKVQKHKGQRWEVEYVVVPLNRASFAEWDAWLTSMNGREKTFLGALSEKTTPIGTAANFSDPLVNGVNQTGNSLAIDSGPSSETGYLKAGDYIQLGSGTEARIYQVLEDVNTNGSGEATLTIWPDLYESPADNATITVSNPRGVFRMQDNIWEYTIGSDQLRRGFRFMGLGIVS